MLHGGQNRRLFSDHNVDTAVSTRLENMGHDVLRIQDSGLRNDAQDPEVAIFARNKDRIIITADKAFELVKPSHYAPSRLSLHDTSNDTYVSAPHIGGSSRLEVRPVRGIHIMKGSTRAGHNGIVKYQQRDYGAHSVLNAADQINTYLRMNLEGYIKSRTNNVSP